MIAYHLGGHPLVELKVQVGHLPNWKDTLLVKRRASDWVQKVKHKPAGNINNPSSLLQEGVLCFESAAGHTFTLHTSLSVQQPTANGDCAHFLSANSSTTHHSSLGRPHQLEHLTPQRGPATQSKPSSSAVVTPPILDKDRPPSASSQTTGNHRQTDPQSELPKLPCLRVQCVHGLLAVLCPYPDTSKTQFSLGTSRHALSLQKTTSGKARTRELAVSPNRQNHTPAVRHVTVKAPFQKTIDSTTTYEPTQSASHGEAKRICEIATSWLQRKKKNSLFTPTLCTGPCCPSLVIKKLQLFKMCRRPRTRICGHQKQ